MNDKHYDYKVTLSFYINEESIAKDISIEATIPFDSKLIIEVVDENNHHSNNVLKRFTIKGSQYKTSIYSELKNYLYSKDDLAINIFWKQKNKIVAVGVDMTGCFRWERDDYTVNTILFNIEEVDYTEENDLFDFDLNYVETMISNN